MTDAATAVDTGTQASAGYGQASRGREEAAALMWNWQEKPDNRDADKTSVLRKKGMMQGGVGLVIAGIFFFVLKWQIMAYVVTTIASITLLTALASPTGAYAAIERALTKFAAAVGVAVGWLVMMPIFLGFFVPFGLLFRRGKKDSMKRLFSPDEKTYWKERVADEDMEGRRRSQF